ncbi:venom carboxylesterase-6-like [Rhodnius prolixus]|uniref:venom carboxylesterase-6-like n=1 Tax=Rhodnius prolixus TaxID=13249 RepID=UPI003D18A537
MWKAIFYLLFSTNLCTAVTVKTKFGEVRGGERKSRDGKTYYAFTSIPYAKPPIGKLRLKNPVRAEPWKEVLDATKELPQCIQVPMYQHFLRNVTFGEEDCLYLSVYTPELNPKERLAVLVHLHGGGLKFGDAGPRDNADFLVDGNIILVTMHYRLGTLGFLSIENSIIPGNFGLKDQSMGLQWVKENIKAFGGDDERITAFGSSSGGICAHFHMFSPLSKSILRGAISQSGVVNRFWLVSAPGTAKPLAERVAEIVGCGGKQDEELLGCLQSICPIKLIRAELEFLYWDYEPAVVFRPVQEPSAAGAFLPFDPLTQKTTLPWLTGIVNNEGLCKTVSLMAQGDSVVQEFIDNMDDYMMRLLSLDASCPKAKATVKLIKEKYFPKPVTLESVMNKMEEFYADLTFVAPMGDAIRRHKGPLYQFLYDYRAGSSLSTSFGNFTDLGVFHGDDLLVLFNMKEKFPKTNLDEEQVSKKMVRLWTNFAKYQKPTTEEDEVEWPRYDSLGRYMHITSGLEVKRHLKADVIDWWFKLPAFSSYEALKTEL